MTEFEFNNIISPDRIYAENIRHVLDALIFKNENDFNGLIEQMPNSISFPTRLDDVKQDYITELLNARDDFEKSQKTVDDYDEFNQRTIWAWNRAVFRIDTPQYDHPEFNEMFKDFQKIMNEKHHKIRTETHEKLSPSVAKEWDEIQKDRKEWVDYERAQVRGDNTIQKPTKPMKPYSEPTPEHHANKALALAESYEHLASLSIEQIRDREKQIWGDEYEKETMAAKTDEECQQRIGLFKLWAQRHKAEYETQIAQIKQSTQETATTQIDREQ